MAPFKARDDLAQTAAEAGQASSWFVPPLVVPAFLVALTVAYVVYSGLSLIGRRRGSALRGRSGQADRQASREKRRDGVDLLCAHQRRRVTAP
jgi:hypothetical protein